MFEIRLYEDHHEQQDELREFQEEFKDLKILKQIFHWIISYWGLWNTSVGRDFIGSIESIESGVSIIDHILSTKDEEENWPMEVIEENQIRSMEPYEQGLVRQIERDNIVDAQPQVNVQRNCK